MTFESGFLKLADELTATGARYGSTSVKDAFTSYEASRNVSEMAGVLREALNEAFQLQRRKACCFTIDVD